MPQIQRRVDQLLAARQVLITGMIEGELLGGAGTEKEFDELKDLLSGLGRIEEERPDWAAAARMVFDLRRLGATVPFTDALIARLASRVGAGIVHADGDFTRLCAHFGIRQEDLTRLVRGSRGR